MIRLGIWLMIFVLGVVLVCSREAAADVNAADAGAELYKRLDAKTLGETLRRLRMGVLLEALADETDDPQFKIEALLFQADAADTELRDKLLTRAAATIKTEYEALDKKLQALPPERRSGDEFDDDMIALYKLRLRYVQVQALQRGQGYIDRLTFLLGGEQDRRALQKLISQAAKLLQRTQLYLEEEIRAARSDTDKTKMVYLVPELEDVQAQLEFTAGKLRYYAALVLPKTITDKDGKKIPNPARITLLNKAVRDLQRFADEPEYGVQSFSKLQQGRANRMRGNFDEAREQLAWAAGDRADKSVLAEALFEIVRNETERAASLLRNTKQKDHVQAGNRAFARAEAALEEFRNRAPEAHPQLGVDVKALVLGHYLYEQWAESLRVAGQEKQAESCDKNAQQVFVSFLEKYKDPGIQAAVGKLFRDKFRGKDLDLKNLAPGIVLLLATMELQDATALLEGRSIDALDPQAKARVEALLNKTEEMLLAVKDNKSPEAKKTLPDALWKLGVCYVLKNRNFQAGEMFRRLVKEFPDHPQARNAALNAVKIANQLVAGQIQQGKSVSPQRRRELVESIRVLLKHWPEDKEAAKYHYDLAWQCEKLAATEEGEKRRAWLDEAIANYQAVPSDSPYYNEARFYALELRYRLLQAMPAGEDRNKQARQLRGDMVKFGGDMYALWQKQTDPKVKAELGRFGSTSEFQAEVISHDILGQQEDALKKIDTLSARWPGTKVLREGSEFAIRSRLARGDVQQALAQFEAFQKKYGDEQAQGLMTVVVEKLRRAIQDLSLEPGKQEQLQRFREAYIAFAKKVYDAGIEGASATDRYYLTMLYADSLVQTGTVENARQALRLYEGLGATDAKRREEANAKVTAAFAPLHKQAQATGGHEEKLAVMQSRMMDMIYKYQLEGWTNSKVEQAKYLYDRMFKAGGDEKKDLADMVARAQIAALEAIEKHLLEQTPIDATVLMGMANCHETLKQYSRAFEEYGKLTEGLDPNRNPRTYWEAQLGYCRSFFEAYKSDPEQIQGLLARIQSLRNTAPPRWIGKLNLIENQIEKAKRK